ncbi:bifunctional adenosylcobinamide kinase/adenosylcobinamide-phosphate guanylyltransferase [Mycolicibacterium stellerae]|uniref:bifunctional adenosylcobinamide kinase/adenosylcobinamide-phosphate guanylyltransferase n=1 Tax=Mycolicibacterium stellerae TaxID=2358193 RepID=UPI000F0BC1F1|nr:bifunctional adenosylcobinamide kinase/adenosylcobinamide-phosphate guanylyltransferase [Mycolicibacterium stellerae]
MRILVLGGIRSGKSEWAESVIGQSVGGEVPVRYLATGPVADDDTWAARVAAHRARRPHHWLTAETLNAAKQLRADDSMPTLVDDIGGWLTAAMDRADAWTGGSAQADIDDLVDAVAGHEADLVLVSPEVGMTVVPETVAGRRFADELGALNQRLAQLCDRVVLVVAGQPIAVKEPS